MYQKNAALVLALALIITALLLGIGYLWFIHQPDPKIGSSSESRPHGSDTLTLSNSNRTKPKSTGRENFSQVGNVPSGLFNYGGSTTWAPVRLVVDSAIKAARPEYQLRYVEPVSDQPGSTTGIKMLINGQLAFAQSSRPLHSKEYQQAEQRGFSLQQIPIAIDGLAVAVHPNLNISGLTIEQLKPIYTGKITNWKQVGGSDIPVQTFSRPINSSGTVNMFMEEVLAGQEFSSKVQFIGTTTEALRRLANSLGGIYYASASEVVPQCTIKPLPLGRNAKQLVPPYKEPFIPLEQCPGKRNQLNLEAFKKAQYPMTRDLFVVVKQNGQIEEQAGLAYANLLLSNQGQELISNAGFVRIR